MKKLLIVFCCAFTAVTLFCSFNLTEKGSAHIMVTHGMVAVEKVQVDGHNYIVVQSARGIAICPESK